jgi:hypothetical protein
VSTTTGMHIANEGTKEGGGACSREHSFRSLRRRPARLRARSSSRWLSRKRAPSKLCLTPSTARCCSTSTPGWNFLTILPREWLVHSPVAVEHAHAHTHSMPCTDAHTRTCACARAHVITSTHTVALISRLARVLISRLARVHLISRLARVHAQRHVWDRIVSLSRVQTPLSATERRRPEVDWLSALTTHTISALARHHAVSSFPLATTATTTLTQSRMLAHAHACARTRISIRARAHAHVHAHALARNGAPLSVSHAVSSNGRVCAFAVCADLRFAHVSTSVRVSYLRKAARGHATWEPRPPSCVRVRVP